MPYPTQPTDSRSEHSSLASCCKPFGDEFRRLIIEDAVRHGLSGVGLSLFVEREARLAQLDALSEHHGAWTDEEHAEYRALCDMQEAPHLQDA